MKHLKDYSEPYKKFEKFLYYGDSELPLGLKFKLGDCVYIYGDKNENIYKLVYYNSVKKMWFLDDEYIIKDPSHTRLQPEDKLILVPDHIVYAKKYNL